MPNRLGETRRIPRDVARGRNPWTAVPHCRKSPHSSTTYWNRPNSRDTDLVIKFKLKNVILSLILRTNLTELVSRRKYHVGLGRFNKLMPNYGPWINFLVLYFSKQKLSLCKCRNIFVETFLRIKTDGLICNSDSIKILTGNNE